ncbi:hypothetical protein FSP39_019626 [Pinctada imbricata]|uniref:Receptor ligand binding region domain-containing protein n=1 Tax=Pinctada imbricata TaxID=66713 RepID=A0AA89BZ19_PINIB|nr:hypothetical protein FSP39_019626 [Pinctada imbricata]
MGSRKIYVISPIVITLCIFQQLICVRPYKITVMVPTLPTERLFSLAKIKPAVEIAREKIRTKGLLSENNLNITYVDTEESEVTTPVRAFDIIKNGGQNVFLGPVSDFVLSPVAQYSVHWNVPIVTPGGLSHDYSVNRNKEYKTLTRIGLGFESAVKFLEEYILRKYKWRRILTIYDNMRDGYFRGYNYLLGNAITYYISLTSYETEYVLIPRELLENSHNENGREKLDIFYEKTLKDKIGNDFGADLMQGPGLDTGGEPVAIEYADFGIFPGESVHGRVAPVFAWL